MADVDPHAAVDESLDIDEFDVRATGRERASMVDHQLAHLPTNRYCETLMRGNMAQATDCAGAVAPFADELRPESDVGPPRGSWSFHQHGHHGGIDALAVKDLLSGMLRASPFRLSLRFE